MPGQDHSHLVGTHVRLIPYARGGVPRETLPVLWYLIEKSGDHEKLFTAQQVPQTPYSWRGDPTEFMAYVSDPKRLLFIVQDTKDEAVVGLWWLDDIVPGYRASANIWMARRAWGKPAREASTLGIDYAFSVLGMEAIWAYTPHQAAKRHAEAVGLTLVATLPGYILTAEGPRDVFVLRRMRNG